jgi:hypothetical protein
MPDYLQSQDELNKQLIEQIDFLRNSIDGYDRGKIYEAKRLALHLRILLHDHGQSKSLLGSLNKKGNFYSSVGESLTTKPHEVLMGSYTPLVGISHANGYVPLLDSTQGKLIPFDEYWNEVVIDNRQGNIFTRRELVLSVADQDGGAHVDLRLNQAYAELSRNNSVGWIVGDGKNWSPLVGIELATVRQITHEVLKTLLPVYIQASEGSNDFNFSHVSLIGTTEDAPAPDIGRNEKCPCGSGKKYKKCGLLSTEEHKDLMAKRT